MIAHFFKMVWNRRRANALILIELLVSFLVLCAVLTAASLSLDYWRQPLGFEYENAWELKLTMGDYIALNEAGMDGAWSNIDQICRLLDGRDEIESYTPLSANIPFGTSTMGYRDFVGGVECMVNDLQVKPEALETLNLNLVAGRWLEPGDEILDRIPVVITRNYARAKFGGEDPIGKLLVHRDKNGEQDDKNEFQVVGMVDIWRQRGELDAAAMAMFTPVKWGVPARAPENFIVRVRPGTRAEFEEVLAREVGKLAPGWTVNVGRLVEYRDKHMKEMILPILTGTVVAIFMILLVGLGLVGVLWQSVTRRTEEIGLRRAMGASAGEIRWQVLGELMALVTLAVGIGILLFIQFPLLQLGGDIPLHVYASGLGLSLVLIYSFVLVCGLYPSMLATRVQPAAALQYE